MKLALPLLLLASCAPAPVPVWTGGEAFDDGRTTPLAEVLRDGAALAKAGTKVRVEGTVAKVCQSAG
jgi:hypothetical protein